MKTISRRDFRAFILLLMFQALLLGFPVDEGLAEDQTERRFVLDNGTLQTRPSPRSMVQFYQNFETLGLEAYDLMEEYVYQTDDEAIDDSHWWTRTRRGLQSVFMPFVTGEGEAIINPSGYIATSGLETVHEYAHRTRGAFFGIEQGFNPKFRDFGDNPYSIAFHLARTDNATGTEIWKNGTIKFLYPQPYFLSGEQSLFISAAAGINQQVNLARDHAKRAALDGDRLDIANFYPYYINSSSYFIYNDDIIEYIFSGGDGEDATIDDPVGDRAAMIRSWKRQGRNYNDKDLARNQIIATGLSGTTWAYILGTADYIQNGQRQAEVLRFWNFRLPDFYNYYNTEGPTLMISSDYRLADDKLISFAFETVTDGKSSDEIGLGYNQTFDVQSGLIQEVDAGVEIAYNADTGAINRGVEAGLKVHEHAVISTGYNYYDFDTLRGQRDIPTLKKGKSFHELHARLVVNF